MFATRYHRRRPIPKDTLLLAVAAVVFLIALVSTFLPANKAPKPSAPPPADIEFTITGINDENDQTIRVWLDGVITDMPLEEYLVGVVAGEIPASYELEALKAQAVAARTYTIYKRNHGGCSAHSGADICTDSTHCQAYMTADEMAEAWGADTQTYLDKIITAVQSTAGEIIYYEGEEIQVFYHASSGGRTENCENVYPQALPYLVSVESTGEESSSRYYGEVTVSRNDFIRRIKAFSSSISFDGVPLIGNITRFESGRVQSIKVGSETFTGREIREIFGLNSTNFTVATADDKVTFSTIGFGHGVGMSQTGANAMAKQGADYIDILTHYFQGVTVK